MRDDSEGASKGWWVTEAGQPPVGPVSTELLLRGITAGKIPREALVCVVGGRAWTGVLDTPPFSLEFHRLGDAVHGARGAVATWGAARHGASEPPPRFDTQRPLQRVGEAMDEHTIVDRPDFASPSEPPPIQVYEGPLPEEPLMGPAAGGSSERR